MFLKVSLVRGTLRFGQKGKLSRRFIGPYEILSRIGDMAYRLALPPKLLGEPLEIREDAAMLRNRSGSLTRKSKN